LLDVANYHNVDIEGQCNGGSAPLEVRRTENWVETTYGEGVHCFACHVKISNKYDSILPERPIEENEEFKETWNEEYGSTSRLACQIKLDKRHDGMVVFVPDAPVTALI
jgi:ferredoxin